MKRHVKRVIQGFQTSDGAGVKLTRVIGSQDVRDVDPFLMLDAFDSTNPRDYIAGFPFHPHRGIETFTYLIHGIIEHQDSLGNKGVIRDGQAQWMTAGSGIIHQEMPQPAPRMLGLQLWINLPQKDKMCEPAYWDILEYHVQPIIKDGYTIRVISGSVDGVSPKIQPKYVQARILDISLTKDEVFALNVSSDSTLFIYTFNSELLNVEDHTLLPKRSAVLLNEGTKVELKAITDSRFLWFEGLPLNEPVAFGGPIVMNTKEELALAFRELREGTFIKHK
ncbi:MAG TPA: pirin family protein [Erysipelotrichaceae bacterium]|nr:pirin family protein [Erysipelotrichaceae bacterium]